MPTPFVRVHRRLPWWAALLLLVPLPVRAQAPSRVADLDPGPLGADAQPSYYLSAAGGKVFFDGFTATSGKELWASDGTAGGTELLGDLCPGSCDSTNEPVAELRGLFLFVRNQELWRSDGTRKGTFALSSTPAPSPLGAGSYAKLGDSLYFLSCPTPARTACRLYRTDGTAAGTLPVDPEDPNISSTAWSGLAVAGNRLYFAAGQGTADTLRVSTGGASTVLLQLPGAARALTAVGSRLYFLAPRAAGPGEQLWTSDGTTAGTVPLTSFPGHSPFRLSPFEDLQALGSRLYFLADDGVHGRQIWRTEGTPASTLRVTAVAPPKRLDSLEVAAAGPHLIYRVLDGPGRGLLWTIEEGHPETNQVLTSADVDFQLFNAAGKQFFSVRIPNGSQVWASDGTPAGTGIFRGLCGGRCLTRTSLFRGADAWYLAADDPGVDTALYRTDGTAAGTRRVATLPRVGVSSRMAQAGSRLFFLLFPPSGPELWESDGATTAGPVYAFPKAPASANPEALTALSDRLVFAACDGEARQLWGIAGPSAPPVKIADLGFHCDSFHGDLLATAVTSGAVFALATKGSPQTTTLLRTDGTPEGTQELKSFAAVPQSLLAFQDRVWFQAPDDGGKDLVLWTSDGTPSGTVPVFPLPAGTFLNEGFAAGDAFYFVGWTADSQYQIWRSDGTAAGTRPLAIPAYDNSVSPEFTRLGSAVFFFAGTSFSRPQLWKTDDSPGGASLVLDRDRVGMPSTLREAGGALYFFSSSSPSSDPALLRTDGTAAGTTVVRTFPQLPFQEEAVSFAGRLFFAAGDGEHGLELWATDGTAAGTLLVRDLFPGPAGSRISGLRVAGGRLFFSADDGVHGNEIWQSDGTAEGTRRVSDIAPEALSSDPGPGTAALDRLYFAADDGVTGRELWTLPLTDPGCEAGDTRLCLFGNRFRVEVAWTDFAGRTGVGHTLPLTADTGAFWFFDPGNVELIVKVLDARPLNQAFWVFYGALSNVQYALTVTDVQTGLARRYWNPAGHLASEGDTAGFGPLGAYAATPAGREAPATASPHLSVVTEAGAAAGGCVPSPERLCLQGGRFAVEAAWKDFQGKTGAGVAVPLTGDTGYFWFFGATNVEVVAKVLDGTGLNGKFWFFSGALSNVEYTLTVTDTRTGAVKRYRNPAGQFASVADTGAF